MLLVFCLINLFNIYLFLSKRYKLFIFFSIAILFIEPIFQKLTDETLTGATFNVFGFDRLKSNLVIIASYIIILANSNINRLPRTITKPIDRYVFVVLIFHLFNIVFSYNLENSIAISTVSILGPILFFYILLRLPNETYFSSADLLKIIYGTIIIFLFIGLYMYSQTLVKSGAFDAENGRTGGGLWLSNISSQILVLFFPLVFSKIRFRFSRITKILVIILYIILLVISLSRTGLIVYSLLLLMVFRKSNKKILFAIISLFLFSIVLNFSKELFNMDIVELYSQRFAGKGNTIETVKNDSRFEIYKEGFTIAEGHEIIGTGISSFNVLNKNGFSNAHNILVNIFVERGLIGLILLILFISYFVSTNKTAVKVSFSHEYEFLRLIKIGFIGFFLIGLTGNDLFVNSGFINGWATYILVFLLSIQVKKIALAYNN